MADPIRTDDLNLGPGLVVTPGYEVPLVPAMPKGGQPLYSDRPLDARGEPLHDFPTLSTYGAEAAAVEEVALVPEPTDAAPAAPPDRAVGTEMVEPRRATRK